MAKLKLYKDLIIAVELGFGVMFHSSSVMIREHYGYYFQPYMGGVELDSQMQL